MFSLFVLHSLADARVYAFEPVPLFELLRANTESFGARVRLSSRSASPTARERPL
jgi:hypothetical protein